MPVRIKVCGITRETDAIEAANLGVDAIGLVFYKHSPRFVTIEQANRVIAALPPFVTVVGLFVNPDETTVKEVLERCAIDVLQFHGDESPDFCRTFKRPYLKAIRVRKAEDVVNAAQHFTDARAILADAFVDGSFGGTGQMCDWSLLPRELSLPLILSGGLDADNIEQAIRLVHPAAVDVSSGVEESKGIKSAARMAAFIAGVKHAGL